MPESPPDAGFGVEMIDLDLPPLVGGLSRRLHEAGLPTTPARSADFARALRLVNPILRTRLYWTARAVFVSDPSQVPVFDSVFLSIFAGAPAEGGFEPDPVNILPAAPPAEMAGHNALTPAAEPGEGNRWMGRSSAASAADEDDENESLAPLGMPSDEELLRGKSFDALEPDELAQLYRLMSRLELATPLRRTRRRRRDRRGRHVDMRRTLRASLRTGGEPIRPARRSRRVARRRLVMMCDISGSMEPYARAYLQFLTCAAGSGPNAEAFVFATRLTRLTRALALRNPDRAIMRAAAAAPDWSSGTRIGDALKAFNDLHGRRGMARGAVVVILSDGWERGDPGLVGREMERLARLAYRIIWVNPRVSGRAFSVQVGGMVAALPHCDALVSGHSFQALHEVVEAIGAPRGARRALEDRAAGLIPPSGESPEEEPWGSAIPVAGSSVAMPSGYSPSRGRTTPGWSIGHNQRGSSADE